jgi:hypothetical protein
MGRTQGLALTISNEKRGVLGFGAGLAGLAALLCAMTAAVGCGGNADEPPCQDGTDDCLPVSHEPCERDGSSYASGTSAPAGDGCNTCWCGEVGWTCTTQACGRDSCVYDGRVFPDTSTFSSTDGCNTCGCSDGEVACTDRGCPIVPIVPPPTVCSYAGEQLGQAESRTATDGCNTCTCSNGVMVCSQRACTPGCFADTECGDGQYCYFATSLCFNFGLTSSSSESSSSSNSAASNAASGSADTAMELRAPSSGAQPLPLPPSDMAAPLTVGECRERPTQCAGAAQPVCGCDGVTYRTACAAASLGLNLASAGPCPQND